MKLNELELRIYKEKKCVGFTYFLNLEDNKKQRFDFVLDETNNEYEGRAWEMTTLFEPPNGGTQVYRICFVIPRNDIPLITIAGMGLKLFQTYLKEEIQLKSCIDFSIGQVVNDY
jgi:hypothetical protein